jgi:hypothetical protein
MGEIPPADGSWINAAAERLNRAWKNRERPPIDAAETTAPDQGEPVGRDLATSAFRPPAGSPPPELASHPDYNPNGFRGFRIVLGPEISRSGELE